MMKKTILFILAIIVIAVCLCSCVSAKDIDYSVWTKADWSAAANNEKQYCTAWLFNATSGADIDLLNQGAYNNQLDVSGTQYIFDGMEENETLGEYVDAYLDTMKNNQITSDPEVDSYLGWYKEDWQNASYEERKSCCLAAAAHIYGVSFDTVESLPEEDIKEGTEQIMQGIEKLYASGDYDSYSIGELISYIK